MIYLCVIFFQQKHLIFQKPEQNFSIGSLLTKSFYAEKSNSNKIISIEPKEDVKDQTQNILLNDDSELKKNEIKTISEVSNVCDQQSTSKSFFDTVSQFGESNSSTKRESPAKKKVALSFLDKNPVKSTKMSLEPKYETKFKNESKDSGSKSDTKLECEVPPKKTGKISDYFQRLQKH